LRDTQENLRKMEDNLKGVEKPPVLPYKKKLFQAPRTPYLIDICAINAAGFYYNLMRPENELLAPLYMRLIGSLSPDRKWKIGSHKSLMLIGSLRTCSLRRHQTHCPPTAYMTIRFIWTSPIHLDSAHSIG
jgi:hypothetical protein